MADFVVGIDLGTTHCVIAAASLQHPSVRLVDVPQLIAPGEVASRKLLPSFMYLPVPGEFSTDELTLPWGTADAIVGEMAERCGAKSPQRWVSSAKSWVCHGGVNRRAPILPWNAPEGEPHVSPFDAQVAYLRHLAAVWDHDHPFAPIAEQDVVVTVPASFDEGARELTVAAAAEAGLGPVRLLEEPQAAFYDFVGAQGDDLEAELGDARLILVVDVGGGTTDLTLLRVVPATSPGEPRIDRIAVGGHLMLGGDNMDAAVATFALEQAKLERPKDATVWSALVQSARQAKERLLAAEAPDQAVVSVQARGSRLIASTHSIALRRDETVRMLLDGFLPCTGPAEVAQRASKAGLTTLGLPYTSDTAIGRHICSFLRRHVEAARLAGAQIYDGLPRPDRLLLNGGVFNGPALIERIQALFTGWYGAPIQLLEHTSLDMAVARGAARSALARRGVGEVIGGGTARAYYIGIEGPAGGKEALCVAPRGMEDGVALDVPSRSFDLVLDRPVAFPLFVYTGDRTDAIGDLVEGDLEAQGLDALPWLVTSLRFEGQASAADSVPVTLRTNLTELGHLELHVVTVDLPPRRWRLEFSLHHPPAATPSSSDDEPPPPLAEGFTAAERLFIRQITTADPGPVKGLRRDLEGILGPRDKWSVTTCRALFGLCMEYERDRGRSEVHELNWLRLCGFCLRPGFGAEGDAERTRELWRLRDSGLRQPSKAVWAEWWIAWRRITPGLDAQQQQQLFDDVRPWLWRDSKPPPGPHAHGVVEMMQLAASLDRLPASSKAAVGELLLGRSAKLGSYWALARVGAREPFHGTIGDVVDGGTARGWVERLLELDWSKADGAAFAAACMARSTQADPSRDVGETVRNEVAVRLRATKAPSRWLDILYGGSLSATDTAHVLGDSLPVGLRLR